MKFSYARARLLPASIGERTSREARQGRGALTAEGGNGKKDVVKGKMWSRRCIHVTECVGCSY